MDVERPAGDLSPPSDRCRRERFERVLRSPSFAAGCMMDTQVEITVASLAIDAALAGPNRPPGRSASSRTSKSL